MIDLGKIKQGERGTLTITWEFPDSLTSPASISGATITAVMENMDTGDVTAVSGTLTATGATTATWALSSGDSGTAGTFHVTFRADVSGTPTYTLNAALEVEENPAATAVQNSALVGVTSAEAAWVTAGLAAGGAATEDNLASFSAAGVPEDSGVAKTAVGNATKLQARTLASTAPTDGQVVAWNDGAAQWEPADAPGGAVDSVNGATGVVVLAASDVGAYATGDYSAAPTAAEPLKADGSGGIKITGKVAFGTRTPSADDTALNIVRAVGDTVNSHGVRDESLLTATTPATGYASFDAQYTAGGTAAYSHIAAFQARMLYNGAGTLTEWRGYQSAPVLQGPTTQVKHIDMVNASKSGGGTLTHQYGLFVNALTSGTSSNYAIYTMPSTPSWFSGIINIGISKDDTGSAVNNGHLVIRGVSGNNQFQFGYHNSNNYAWLQAATYGTAFRPIALNPNGGNVIIGNSATPAGALHVDQAASGGAVPVLYLDQADVSEEIIEIVSTAGEGNAVELVGAKTLTVTEFIKVTINGNTRYIAAGTIA